MKNYGKMNVIVSSEITSVCPTFVGACLDAKVENSQYSAKLWEEIEQLGADFRVISGSGPRSRMACSRSSSL